jgi:hypothetical protein
MFYFVLKLFNYCKSKVPLIMSQIPLIDLDDYHYAVQLDKDLNGAASPICGEDRFSPVSAYFKQDILTANNFLRTASTNSQNEVTFDNQQAITVSFKIVFFLFEC